MPYVLDHDWRGRPLAPPHPSFELFREGDLVHLEVDAPYWGDPAPKEEAGRLWALWSYEVVELFVAGSDARYIELELGPHGHHLFLALAGIRRIEDEALPLMDYDMRRGEGRWKGRASFEAKLLPPGPHLFNLCAIRGQGTREYRSLVALPGEVADFHQPDLFVACGGALLPSSGP